MVQSHLTVPLLHLALLRLKALLLLKVRMLLKVLLHLKVLMLLKALIRQMVPIHPSRKT